MSRTILKFNPFTLWHLNILYLLFTFWATAGQRAIRRSVHACPERVSRQSIGRALKWVSQRKLSGGWMWFTSLPKWMWRWVSQGYARVHEAWRKTDGFSCFVAYRLFLTQQFPALFKMANILKTENICLSFSLVLLLHFLWFYFCPIQTTSIFLNNILDCFIYI